MKTWRKFVKYFFETSYWTWARVKQGRLKNEHYEFYCTTHFGLDKAFYSGKRILDVGCGPRGSLEWADVAVERVGLDPLVPAYRRLGINRHRMSYVAEASENMPFDDGHFDVVCSVNSLDHVHDLDATCRQIIRVLKPGGTFLLLTDVHPEPTLCEPTTFSWDVVERFAPPLELKDCRHYEKAFPMMGRNLKEASPFDHGDATQRHGILSARFAKPGG
jgi:SAM-dependent methyltransferase